MNKHTIVSLILLGAVIPASAFNGDFESGDYFSWTVSNPMITSEWQPEPFVAGSVEVVSSYFQNQMPAPRAAQAGNYFLAIGTSCCAHADNLALTDISAQHSLNLQAGAVVSGWAFYFNGDHAEQDMVWVRIYDDTGTNVIATPWLEVSGDAALGGNSSIPYRQATDWTYWEWIAPTTGNYQLTLGASTMGDNVLATYGFFDGINVSSPVPEPSTASLFGFIAASLFWQWRRQRSTKLNALGER
jgi:hypothetical protein